MIIPTLVYLLLSSIEIRQVFNCGSCVETQYYALNIVVANKTYQHKTTTLPIFSRHEQVEALLDDEGLKIPINGKILIHKPVLQPDAIADSMTNVVQIAPIQYMDLIIPESQIISIMGEAYDSCDFIPYDDAILYLTGAKSVNKTLLDFSTIKLNTKQHNEIEILLAYKQHEVRRKSKRYECNYTEFCQIMQHESIEYNDVTYGLAKLEHIIYKLFETSNDKLSLKSGNMQITTCGVYVRLFKNV